MRETQAACKEGKQESPGVGTGSVKCYALADCDYIAVALNLANVSMGRFTYINGFWEGLSACNAVASLGCKRSLFEKKSPFDTDSHVPSDTNRRS